MRLALVVGALGVVIAAVLVGLELRRRRKERVLIDATRADLERARELLGFLEYPRGKPGANDATGQAAVSHSEGADVMRLLYSGEEDRELARVCDQLLGAQLRDARGQLVIYRCPGPVHTHGYDLYSVGPNGIDELGEGDDIVVGADVAALGSAG